MTTTRRHFLQTTAAAGAGLALDWRSLGAQSGRDGFGFFVISDTHMLANAAAPEQIDAARFAMNERLIDTLNTLPGQTLPSALGGGTVAAPRAVLHLGDIADSGDKLGPDHELMTTTEWNAHTKLYGLQGRDGRLRYPIYEIHGNHDTPRGENLTIRGLVARNRQRRGIVNRSANGLHYSWDWNDIHFVALGIVVGVNNEDLPVSRYGAYDSLAFLEKDLAAHVRNSGRPVILLQHVDLQRYSKPVDGETAGGSRVVCCEGMAKIAWHSKNCPEHAAGISMSEWSPADVRAYWRAIERYNIAAIFHGHLHARRTDRWDGKAIDAQTGIPVFGVKNAGAGGNNRAFFYCAVDADTLVIREYQSLGELGWSQSDDVRWGTEMWKVPLRKRKGA